jgi:hypothetical protein
MRERERERDERCNLPFHGVVLVWKEHKTSSFHGRGGSSSTGGEQPAHKANKQNAENQKMGR